MNGLALLLTTDSSQAAANVTAAVITPTTRSQTGAPKTNQGTQATRKLDIAPPLDQLPETAITFSPIASAKASLGRRMRLEEVSSQPPPPKRSPAHRERGPRQAFSRCAGHP